jgi:hypothetical protein
LYSASSLKQQSTDRHVATLGYIILIPSHPVFVLSPYYCVLSGEATNTNCIVFGLTRSELEPTTHRTRGEHSNHYTTDAVFSVNGKRGSTITTYEKLWENSNIFIRKEKVLLFLLSYNSCLKKKQVSCQVKQNDKKSVNVHVYLYEFIELSSNQSVTQSDFHLYMTTANVNMNMWLTYVHCFNGIWFGSIVWVGKYRLFNTWS